MAVRSDFSTDLRFIDGRRRDMTETLRAWCAQNSGSGNAAGMSVMRAAIADAFAALGAPVETIEAEPYTVVAADGQIIERRVSPMLRLVRRPHAPVRVLLAGHMDTVFAADHPFQSERFLDPDTLNAPGGADMKGGILVMLNALLALEHSSVAERIGYEVLINADEEIGSIGSASAIREAAQRVDFACVYEPALPDGSLAGARKGSGNLSAIFRGRSAHAGRDHHLGRNAIVAAAAFIANVDRLSGAREGLTVNVARVDGGGANNVVPDLAVVRFNVRIERPEDAVFVRAEIDRLISAANARDGVSASLHGAFNRPPKPMTPEQEGFFEALRETGRELGLNLVWKATGGCCDGNNIAAAGAPVIDTLGARGGAIHSAEEFIRLDSLEERARLSALLLMRIAAGEIAIPARTPETVCT